MIVLKVIKSIPPIEYGKLALIGQYWIRVGWWIQKQSIEQAPNAYYPDI